MTDNSQIFTAVVFSDTTMVFIKIHIQTPMQIVFHTPVHSDSFCDPLFLCYPQAKYRKLSCHRRNQGIKSKPCLKIGLSR